MSRYPKKSATASLKEAIAVLEELKAIEEKELKAELSSIYEKFKPANFFRNAFSQLSTSSTFTKDMLGSVLGLVSGFLARKILVGKSKKGLVNVFGSFLQLSISNLIARMTGSQPLSREEE